MRNHLGSKRVVPTFEELTQEEPIRSIENETMRRYAKGTPINQAREVAEIFEAEETSPPVEKPTPTKNMSKEIAKKEKAAAATAAKAAKAMKDAQRAEYELREAHTRSSWDEGLF